MGDTRCPPQLQEIAFWLETSKMAVNLTGNLLGGPIAADMLKNMQSAINTTANPALLQVYPTLLVLSAHYNTQLGLLAALDIESVAEDIAWRTRIPSLASVLAFELHKAGVPPSYYVRAVFQDGAGEAYKTMPLACSARKDGSVAEQVLGTKRCCVIIQPTPRPCHVLQGRERVHGMGSRCCCGLRRSPRCRSGALPAITTARWLASWLLCGVRDTVAAYIVCPHGWCVIIKIVITTTSLLICSRTGRGICWCNTQQAPL